MISDLVEDESDDEYEEDGGDYSDSDDEGDPGQLQPRRSARTNLGKPPVRLSEEQISEPVGPRRSTREGKGVPPPRFSPMLAAAIELNTHGSYSEAMASPDAAKWREAMNSELESLIENGVFEMVSNPRRKKMIGTKLVFRIKTDQDGNLDKYKARVVAKGLSQMEGVEFDETFAPTVRFDSLKALIAYATSLGLRMEQMDVSTAFLYADLEEEVYVRQPEGSEQEGQEGLVWRLWKCLYGLHQFPRM